MRLLERHLSDPPSCYLHERVYINPKGVTMSESAANDAHMDGMTASFKWKPLTLSFEGKLFFVCCFLRSGLFRSLVGVVLAPELVSVAK